MSTNLVCPLCKMSLQKNQNQYMCSNKHSFDAAKEGYVNLLNQDKKRSKDPGDSKEMMMARADFLSLGHYQPLAEKISEMINSLVGKSAKILDAGCGEGYYLDKIAKSLSTQCESEITGIDISKEGMKRAAKKNKSVTTAVASIFDLPIAEASLDLVYNIFSPICEAEFFRILKFDGKLIVAGPGALHLYELKSQLYTQAYENDESKLNFIKFDALEKIKLEYKFSVTEKDQMLNLIKMTPYYWKTSKESIENLLTTHAEAQEVTASFVITVFQKKENHS